MAKPILVATHQGNIVANAVVDKLREQGHEPYLVYTDKICEASDFFSFKFVRGSAVFAYKDWQLDLSDVGSAWYWRAIVRDRSSLTDIEREMQKTLMGVWETIDMSRWLNHPSAIKRTQNKLMQLSYAQESGLTVIPTFASNSIKRLQQTLPEEFIVKMPGKGIVSKHGNLHVLYSSVLHKRELAYLKSSPFPGMYQPFLSKKKEWRVTIVGDKVFSAAIYTNKHSKVDWRPHSHDKKAVQFVAEDFPVETAEKCKKLLQNLGLRYGAFDFIETEDDELYFVEVNTNGQFLWLENELGFPISDAIADELIGIAST